MMRLDNRTAAHRALELAVAVRCGSCHNAHWLASASWSSTQHVQALTDQGRRHFVLLHTSMQPSGSTLLIADVAGTIDRSS